MEFCKSSRDICAIILLVVLLVVGGSFLLVSGPNALQPATGAVAISKTDKNARSVAVQAVRKSGSAYGKFAARGKVKLIMFEQWGCEYCEQWHEEVGGVYGKTEEGKFAPIEMADYRTARSKYRISGVVFTPTFVLIEDGKEVGRITGYHSEDFFWEFLNDIMNKAGYTSPPASSVPVRSSPAEDAEPKAAAVTDQPG